MSTHKTITLTDAPPIRIVTDEWPEIASASDHEGEFEFQANRKAWVRVRQHADGRTIVYGAYTSQWRGDSDRRAGFLLVESHPSNASKARLSVLVGDDMPNGIVMYVKAVAAAIGWPSLAEACIADLPAVDI